MSFWDRISKAVSTATTNFVAKDAGESKSDDAFLKKTTLTAPALFAKSTPSQTQPLLQITNARIQELQSLLTKQASFNRLHLVFFVHGYWGSPRELQYLQTKMEDIVRDDYIGCNGDSSSIVLTHSVVANHGRTHDGIALGGQRIAQEMNDVIRDIRMTVAVANRFRSQKSTNLDVPEDLPASEEVLSGLLSKQTTQQGLTSDPFTITLSIVGFSLGGLYARYALQHIDAIKQTPTKNNNEAKNVNSTVESFAEVTPKIYCSVSTPHLGNSRHTHLPLPRTVEKALSHMMQQSGRDLFRTVPEQDIIQQLATETCFVKPLRLFEQRIACASTFSTDLQVPTSTAAFLADTDSIHYYHCNNDVHRQSLSQLQQQEQDLEEIEQQGLTTSEHVVAPTMGVDEKISILDLQNGEKAAADVDTIDEPKSDTIVSNINGENAAAADVDAVDEPKTDTIVSNINGDITAAANVDVIDEPKIDTVVSNINSDIAADNGVSVNQNNAIENGFIGSEGTAKIEDAPAVSPSDTTLVDQAAKRNLDVPNNETEIKNTVSIFIAQTPQKNYDSFGNDENTGFLDSAALACRLDAMGWTKIFFDVRPLLLTISNPFATHASHTPNTTLATRTESLPMPIMFTSTTSGSLSADSNANLTSATSSQLLNTLAWANSGESKWVVPMAHTTLVAYSKNDQFAKLSEAGRPFMDVLAQKLVQIIFADSDSKSL